MGGDYFDHPKDEEILKELFEISTGKDDIILDFFGGSGTTGQAVLELNRQDNGNRKYILVQMPESIGTDTDAFRIGFNKISDITINRNKRIVEKLILEKKNQTSDLFSDQKANVILSGLGFKVFRLTKSNFPRIEFAPDPEKTDDENIELLKKYIAQKESQLISAFNRDDLITEILLKNGFFLNYEVTKQHQFTKNDIFLAKDYEKDALICLDYSIDIETVAHFKSNSDKKFICLERALDTTKKYNLKQYLGKLFKSI
jgi:adenine-specific DNA-methyltransferase